MMVQLMFYPTFVMVQKPYTFSRNCASEFELGSFIGMPHSTFTMLGIYGDILQEGPSSQAVRRFGDGNVGRQAHEGRWMVLGS